MPFSSSSVWSDVPLRPPHAEPPLATPATLDDGAAAAPASSDSHSSSPSTGIFRTITSSSFHDASPASESTPCTAHPPPHAPHTALSLHQQPPQGVTLQPAPTLWARLCRGLPWSGEQAGRPATTSPAPDACCAAGEDELSPLTAPASMSTCRKGKGPLTVRSAVLAASRVWDSGTFVMLLASLTFAVSAFAVKLLDGRIPVFQVVCVRSGLSLLVCLGAVRAAGITPMLGQRRHLVLLLLRGLFGALSQSASYFCIDRLPLADAVTLIFLNPALTALAAWFIMRERLGAMGVSGVLVSLVGLVLLTQPSFLFGGPAWSQERIVGTGFGLVAAAVTAAAIIVLRIIGTRETALVMSVYFHGCSILTSVVPLAIGYPRPMVAPHVVEWVLLLVIASTSLGALILFTRALQLITATSASALNFTQVIYSYVFAFLFLHESFTLLGLGGSALLSGGVIMVSSRNTKPPALAAAGEAVDDAPDKAYLKGCGLSPPSRGWAEKALAVQHPEGPGAWEGEEEDREREREREEEHHLLLAVTSAGAV